MISIIPTVYKHLEMLCNTMRDADKRELQKFRKPVSWLVFRSYKNSFIRDSIFVGDNLGAIFGCAGTPLGQTGHPWVLTTNYAEGVPPITFALLYRQRMRNMLKIFPILQSWIDAEHIQACRMAELVGFKRVDEKPMGRNGELFLSYEMRG